jgi:hypothetical protein
MAKVAYAHIEFIADGEPIIANTRIKVRLCLCFIASTPAGSPGR